MSAEDASMFGHDLISYQPTCVRVPNFTLVTETPVEQHCYTFAVNK